MNTDDFIRQVQEDELADSKYIKPVQYAKIRPISSPQVYQALRNHKLAKHTCACGSTVIELEEADRYYYGLRGREWPVRPKEGDDEEPSDETDAAMAPPEIPFDPKPDEE